LGLHCLTSSATSEVCKEEQKRLIEEGNTEAAKALKGSKYVLMTNTETSKQKEKAAKAGKIIAKGSDLFKKPKVKQKSRN
jgi:transposase